MTGSLKKWTVLAMLTALMLIAGGCSLQQKLDVVGKGAITSFNLLLAAAEGKVLSDEINGGWSFPAPDGSIRFFWSKDYSRSPRHDLMMELDAQPFLDAGLDLGKLPESIVYFEGKLLTGTELGKDELIYNGEVSPLAAFEQIVSKYRDSIAYHAPLDHFNVNLGNGNLFEWANDMETNKKDIVFVLNAEPFIAAGVDPGAVAGWTFAKVTVHADGKPTETDQFLKSFDLK